MRWNDLKAKLAALFANRPQPQIVADSPEHRLAKRYELSRGSAFLSSSSELLPILDASLSGFCVRMSPLALAKLSLGDTRTWTLRSRSAKIQVQARLVWKADGIAGMTLPIKSFASHEALSNLLQPFQIGASLQPVAANATQEHAAGKTWLHSEFASDLYAWHDASSGDLLRWELLIAGQSITWTPSDGLQTATMARATGLPATPGAQEAGRLAERSALLGRVADLASAIDHPLGREILGTLAHSQR